MTNATPQRRFDIALSFPGEHRTFVEQVATQLAVTFSQVRVLYDHYHDAVFARPDLDVYLPNLYRIESELLVIFLCPEYATKRWCKLEWRYIRQLIPTLEAERIMFLSFGNPGDLSQIGILSGDGYLEIGDQSPEVIAEKIRKRLNLNRGVTATIPTTAIRSDIDRIIKYAPAELIGREAETALLNDAWEQALGTHRFQRAGLGKSPLGSEGAICPDREPEASRTQARIVTFVALGGEGKTSLVAKWVADLAARGWPGCEAVFAWSFYSQGTREQAAASSDLFLKEALTFFGDDEDKAFAGSSAGAFEKGQRLARVVARQKALLILDGLEPLQYPPSSPMAGELKDQGVAALLKGLAANSHGLCVVTTRYALPDLRAFLGKTVREEKLARLSTEAGVELLQNLGVKGSLRKTFPAEKPRWNEYEMLVEDVKGHALTLQLLGTYLRDAHAGDIRQRDRIKLAEADGANEHRNHAWHVMDAYVKWLAPTGWRAWLKRLFDAKEREIQAEGKRALAVLSLLGLFDRPATADCLNALWRPPAIAGLTEPLMGLSEPQRNRSLRRLEDAKLLTINRDAAGTLLSLDAHPLLREYFAERLKAEGGMMNAGKDSSFILPNSSFREAHRRIYEHLCATTEDKPATLDDLQPLYQGVAHGCQAGLQQEACEKVYRDRILRGTGNDGFYSTKKLGAFGSDLGAVACFFDSLWSRVSPTLTASDQAWLLNEAAFRLRGLGRLTESLEPMRAGLENYVKQENWKSAAIRAGNLSELELTLGLMADAVRGAEQSVDYADRSGDTFQRMSKRTTHADALHQAGRRAEAEALFREAEQMQAERRPEYPLLYSLPGFRYCDLLLQQAERAAWRKDEGGGMKDEFLAACRTVTERAMQTLKIAEDSKLSLLTIALDHLTLGRAALYEAILSAPAASSLIPHPSSFLESAVSGLRRSGNLDDLPRGLLTRAWLRALTGALTGPDSAQEDLDEAWDIAERGSMKLFLADIHLYRARLFGGMRAEGGGMNEAYPWESPEADLAAAERLIKECGYGRRKAELEDAKRLL